MINYLRRLNDALPGLTLGILIYGGLLEIPVVIFAPDRLNWSIGLWYGIVIAEGMAINLASVIYDTTATGDSGTAQKLAVLKSVLRYFVVAAMLFLLGFLKFGNLYMAFAGILGLKVSAYIQPIMGKISRKLVGNNWMYPEDEPFSQEEFPVKEEATTGEGAAREKTESESEETGQNSPAGVKKKDPVNE